MSNDYKNMIPVQLNLFDGISNKDFLEYHREHPQIFEAFEKLAFEAMNKGCKHMGSKRLFEVLRWETNIRGGKDYKINNTYTPLYARLFSNKYPEHKHFFSTRKSKFDQIIVTA